MLNIFKKYTQHALAVFIGSPVNWLGQKLKQNAKLTLEALKKKSYTNTRGEGQFWGRLSQVSEMINFLNG